jgi:hypothetical protein
MNLQLYYFLIAFTNAFSLGQSFEQLFQRISAQQVTNVQHDGYGQTSLAVTQNGAANQKAAQDAQQNAAAQAKVDEQARAKIDAANQKAAQDAQQNAAAQAKVDEQARAKIDAANQKAAEQGCTGNQTAAQRIAKKAAAQKAASDKVAESKAAGKAAPVGVESSVLPNGIQKIAQFPTSDFCKQFLGGKVQEADGVQRKDGGQTCSSTPLGLTPSVTQMLQTLITEPASAAVLDASVNNTVAVRTNSLDSGFFNDPNTEYYLVPSTLNAQTKEIQGHQHITVQKLNSLTAVPDPQVFAFFKGINDVEVDKALKKLNAVIPAGTIKEDGLYRICTISGSDGHQGALSPVMARGSQDDCIRVTFKNSAKVANALIADDAAQNAAVTINGAKSNVISQMDNTGMDAGGQMISDYAEVVIAQS